MDKWLKYKYYAALKVNMRCGILGCIGRSKNYFCQSGERNFGYNRDIRSLQRQIFYLCECFMLRWSPPKTDSNPYMTGTIFYTYNG